MRILIDTEKRKNIAYPLPWNSTGTCFNFRAPTRTVSPGYKPRKPEAIKTLVINCELQNYDFIGKMENLEQLYIYDGRNIKELSFLRNLKKLRQLCLVGTEVDSIEDLLALIELKQKNYEEEVSSPKDEFFVRMKYYFEGIYFQSNNFKGDGMELLENNDLTQKDIWINGKCITHY